MINMWPRMIAENNMDGPQELNRKERSPLD